MAAGQNSLH